MADDKQPQQDTQPKQGEPVEIRVPKRRPVIDALKRAAVRYTSTSK